MIADDHVMVAEAIRAFLAGTYDVVGLVHDGCDVVRAATVLRPDLLLLDLELPSSHGLDLLPEIRRVAPETRVVVITRTLADVVTSAALARGASSVVLKTAPLAELRRAMADALREVAPVTRLADESIAVDGSPLPNWRLLTGRERDILALVGHGLTSAQIATLTSVTERTVHFHRSNIRRKLGLRTDFELHRLAVLADFARVSGPGVLGPTPSPPSHDHP